MLEHLIAHYKDTILLFDYYEDGLFYYSGHSGMDGAEIVAGFEEDGIMNTCRVLSDSVRYLQVNGDEYGV